MGFPDIIGLVGVVLILLAYFLLEIGKIDMTTLTHPVLNLTGALMIIFSLLYQFNLSAMIMELSWSAVSIMGVRRVLALQKQKKQQ